MNDSAVPGLQGYQAQLRGDTALTGVAAAIPGLHMPLDPKAKEKVRTKLALPERAAAVMATERMVRQKFTKVEDTIGPLINTPLEQFKRTPGAMAYLTRPETLDYMPLQSRSGFFDPAPGSGTADQQRDEFTTNTVAERFKTGLDHAERVPSIYPFGLIRSIGRLGTLSEEEQAEANTKRREEAEERVGRVSKRAEVLRQLRRLDGLPTPPGGLSEADIQEAEAAYEQRGQIAAERLSQAKRQEEGTEQGVTQTWWLNALQTATRSGLEVGTSTLKYPVIWGEFLAGYEDGDKSGLRAIIDGVDKGITEALPGDKARSKDFISDLAAASGSMTSFILGGAVARGLGLGAKTGAGLLGSATQGTQQFEDAELHGGSQFQKWAALVIGTGLGATEAIPIDRMFRRLDRITNGAVLDTLRHAPSASMEEFIQELAQSIGSDVVAKYLVGYDPDREMDFADYMRAALVGGITGAGAQIAINTFGNIAQRSNPDDGTDFEAVQLEMQQAFDQTQAIVEEVIPVEPERDVSGIQTKAEIIQTPASVVLTALEESGIDTAEILNTVADASPQLVEIFNRPDVQASAAPIVETIIAELNKAGIDAGPVIAEIQQQLETLSQSIESSTQRISDVQSDQALGDPETVAKTLFRQRINQQAIDIAKLREATESSQSGSDSTPLLEALDGEQILYLGQQVTAGQRADTLAIMESELAEAEQQLSNDQTPDEYLERAAEPIRSVPESSEMDASSSADVSGVANVDTNSLSRRAAGIAEQDATNDENIGLRQIADNFKRLLGLTVRQGRLTLRGKKGTTVLGQYSRKTGGIRLKTWGDYATLVHEGGHALHDVMIDTLQAVVDKHEGEMRRLVDASYGVPANELTKESAKREGFAEFFRLWMTNPKSAQSYTPGFMADWEQFLDDNAPDTRDGLQLIRGQFKIWLQMPSTVALSETLVSTEQPGTLAGKAVREIQDDGLPSWIDAKLSRVYNQTIDRNSAIRKAVWRLVNLSVQNDKRVDLKRSEDPYVLAQMSKGAYGAAMVALKTGIRPYQDIGTASPGLRDAIQVAMGEKSGTKGRTKFDQQRLDDFNAYLVARRAVQEYARYNAGELMRPPVSLNEGDVRQAVRDYDRKYGDAFSDAAQMVYQYQQAMWRKDFEAGFIDLKTYEDGAKKVDYVPFMRDLSDKKGTLGDSGLTSGKASIVKRFRGSDRDIINPLESIMQRTFAQEQNIARNEIRRMLARLADRAGIGSAGIAERISANKIKAINIPAKAAIDKILASEAIDPVDRVEMQSLLDAAFDDQANIQIFRNEVISENGERIVFFWENGKRQAIELGNDELGADLMDALAATGAENMPFLGDFVALTSNIFRATITSWPDFLLVNYVRDQLSAWVLTDVGYKPFVSGLVGMKQELTSSDMARDYSSAKGIMGGMTTATLHQARTDRDIRALETKGYRAEIWGDIRQPWRLGKLARGVSKFTELSETGTRIGIYGAAFNRAKSEGLDDHDAAIEAAYVATDYMDFGRAGSNMMVLRRLIPFLNATMQGLDKTIRTLTAEEVVGRHGKGKISGLGFVFRTVLKDANQMDLTRVEKNALKTARKAWVKVGMLGLVGAILTLMFRDDPDYQEVSEYLRATNWVIPLGSGRVITIPKPFELALLSNVMERGIERFYGDEKAFERFARGAFLQLAPPTDVPLIKTAYELSANHNMFTGRQIVPDYIKSRPNELQFNAYTSEVSKKIGELTGLPPMVVDHVITSFGASAARDMITATNALINPDRTATGLDEQIVFRRFYRDATRGSAAKSDFWKQASTFGGSMHQAGVGFKHHLDSGNLQEANRFLEGLSDTDKPYAVLWGSFEAKYKRLHPFYHARNLNGVISKARKEIIVGSRLEDSVTGEIIQLTARDAAQVDDLLSEWQRREIRNAMVISGASGWVDKQMMPVEATEAILRELSPDVMEEVMRRMQKANVYDRQHVYSVWPEVRKRLLDDEHQAFLDDFLP